MTLLKGVVIFPDGSYYIGSRRENQENQVKQVKKYKLKEYTPKRLIRDKPRLWDYDNNNDYWRDYAAWRRLDPEYRERMRLKRREYYYKVQKTGGKNARTTTRRP